MTGDHIRASCPKCGNYLKFVKHGDLDNIDLKNLKAWQEAQVADQCDFNHGDRYILKDQIDDYLGDFNYCPGCGISLKGDKL
jgi:hypothetical protein